MSQPDMLQSIQDLALASLKAWNLVCSDIEVIKYRENAVFKVVAENGVPFALRVHRSGYHSDAELRSELEWMAALQASGIEVPIVIPAVNGDLFVRTVIPVTGEAAQIDLFEWIDGVQLGSAEEGLGDNAADIERSYRTIGSIAARLHNHGATWNLPTGFSRHAWDVEGLVGEAPFWGRFWELGELTPAQRTLVLQAREIIRSELIGMAASPDYASSYGLIHADFVPDNVMVSNGVVRLIDFDDAGFGWHLFELATALYFIRSDPNFEVARDALIAGYRQHRALPDHVLGKLSVFMMARGLTYLGWVHTRRNTDAAHALTPFVIALACDYAESFVQQFRRNEEVAPAD